MTTSPQSIVLAVNSGSSSVKFALYERPLLTQMMSGKIDRIGVSGTVLSFTRVTESGNETTETHVDVLNHTAAVSVLLNAIELHIHLSAISAVGHRVVHGMDYQTHQRITPEVLEELRRIVPFAPEHLPQEIAIILALAARRPELVQVACFDTVFHHTLPLVAQTLPLPKRFAAQGLRRYGFHGLSYEYLLEELSKVAGDEIVRGKVILAHMGNGVSMTACRGGESVDTSMGLTPLSGLPMSTRTGDLDPGAILAIMRDGNLSSDELAHLLNHESGLLGISGLSSNMQDILEAEHRDERAHLAADYFCYHAKKYIGAYAAVLDGLDTLVFSGGMGENSAPIRARVCSSLSYLGIEIDEDANEKNELVISKEGSRVRVYVIPTNEELMIARTAQKISDILN